MINKRTVKNNLNQILALTEISLKLRLRYKLRLLFVFVSPLITVILPILIMSTFFNFNSRFGVWTEENYLIFSFLAYNLILLKGIIDQFPAQIIFQKYWKTLTALMIAPFNKFNLLFAIFTTHLIYISIPFITFLIICYIIYPVSIFTFLFIIGLFFLIAILFSGVGLIVGIFAIAREDISVVLGFSITLIFWFSCVTYPYEMFPESFQRLIDLNPLYYIFDALRLAWIEDDFIYSLTSHPFHFLILIISTLTIPVIGVIIFNKIYKKYGIAGY